MNLEDFCLLYEYNSWANRRSLDACSTLSDEQFTRDIGSSFRSVRDTLSHICEVEWLWLERWHGRSASSFRPASDFPTLASLRHRWQEVETALIGYIDALKEEDIARVIEHKTTKGVPQVSSALANAAAPGESRHVPSRPGRHNASPTRRNTKFLGSNFLLSRTRRKGLRLMPSAAPSRISSNEKF